MSESEDETINETSHLQLLHGIKKFDKTQHIENPIRKEPSLTASEFSLSKKRQADLEDILKVIEKSKNPKLTSKFRKTQDAEKVIPAPLEKPKLERIKRSAAFDDSKEKLGRWDAVVTANRVANHLSFPLQQTIYKMEPTKTFLSKLKRKSDLEAELDKLEPEKPHEEEEPNEEKYLLTFEEMQERRSLLARIRAKESFKAAKFKRQGKIKSKGYHRIIRKEKLKQQNKEFEELQITNPEEALRRLDELEKTRAKERHTLRHKNTGKWAKNLQVRAKYDKEAREQLAEQLQISRNLTQKVAKSDESDDSEEENNDSSVLVPDNSNPWIMTTSSNTQHKKILPDAIFANGDSSSECDEDTKENNEEDKSEKLNSEVQATTNGWVIEDLKPQFTPEMYKLDMLRQFEDLERTLQSRGKPLIHNHEKEKPKFHKNIEKITESDNEEDKISLEFKHKSKPQIEIPLNEGITVNDMNSHEKVPSNDQSRKVLNEYMEKTKNENIDPNKFIKATPKYLATSITKGEHGFDDLDDDEENPLRADISEVFEEDDVVADFRKEKQAEIDDSKNKIAETILPGWGSWAGSGIKKQHPRKRKARFITKLPVEPPRKDENKGDIIIKETMNKKLLAHKVKELPFPFTSLKDFEASIRAPLGNTFIPENAHKKAIKPSVFTKSGTIIEPMTDEDLVIKKRRKK